MSTKWLHVHHMAKEGSPQHFSCVFFTFTSVWSFDIFVILMKVDIWFPGNFICCKIGQKVMPYFEGIVSHLQSIIIQKSNQPVLALTTSKDFKIGPSTTEIREVSKLPWTLNNPVVLLDISGPQKGVYLRLPERPRFHLCRRSPKGEVISETSFGILGVKAFIWATLE